MQTLVSKGAYARGKSRSPSAVSNWIAEGRITSAALIGEGKRAQIWVERADADLAASLDPAQQLIQRVPVLPGVELAPPPPASPATPALPLGPAPTTAATQRESDLARRAAADADAAEQDAITKTRKNEIEAGRWVNKDEAERAWASELGAYVSATETFLTATLARALADAHGLDFKALSVEIRGLYRRHRQVMTEHAEHELAEVVDGPATVTDDAEQLASV